MLLHLTELPQSTFLNLVLLPVRGDNASVIELAPCLKEKSTKDEPWQGTSRRIRTAQWTHLLSLAQTQEPDTETLEFQQDVVNSRVSVAGQQHAEPARVKDADLRTQAGAPSVISEVLRPNMVPSARITRVQMVVVLPVPGIPTISV